MAENFQTWRRKEISRYRNHREFQTWWTQGNLRHIIKKMAKVKGRITKSSREKQSHRQGNPHKAISWWFCRNCKRKWHDILRVVKEKNLKPRIFYLARLSFIIEREMKNSHKQKLRAHQPWHTYFETCIK